jgi:membrane-bound metal-dependent hydrolase YbcI (DUF457 family)
VGALVALELRPRRGLPEESWGWGTLAPVWLGALLPDLIDKPVMWLGLSAHGRTVGHSVLVWALVCACAAWGRVRGAQGASALGWVALGVVTHGLADALEGALMGGLHGRVWVTSWWLWPWVTPDTWSLAREGAPWPAGRHWIALELLSVAAATWRLVAARRGRRDGGATNDGAAQA